MRNLALARDGYQVHARVKMLCRCVETVTTADPPQRSTRGEPSLRKMLKCNKVRLLTMEEMLCEFIPQIGTTPTANEIGRLLQIVKASGHGLGRG